MNGGEIREADCDEHGEKCNDGELVAPVSAGTS